MYNLGDDSELDRLSRDAAGRYQTPGKPNWERMESELDNVMPGNRKRRFGPFWLLLPVLLAVGGATYWLGSEKNESGKEHATAQSPVKATEPTIATPEIKEQQSQNKTEQQPITANLVKANKEVIPPVTAAPPAITASKSGTVAGNKVLATTDNAKQGSETEKTLNAVVPEVKAENKDLASSNKNTGLPAAAPLATSATVVENTAPQKTNPVNTVAENIQKENKTAEQSPEIQPGKTGMIPHYKPFGKGWSLGFLAGIDKSTVKFAYSSAPGFNVGITAGYHFNQHWSVHTGAIYTHKNYKMNGQDFTPPKGSWVNYYKIENVDGDCSMWDIPLLARYSFSPQGRNSFFLSAGLSSYFMTHESYSYFFHYNNQPITRSMDYASDDTHILSILHLSAGYENRLTKKMSLIIEPYAKLPLGGVGLGDIQLSSFGINFSLQLRQPANK